MEGRGTGVLHRRAAEALRSQLLDRPPAAVSDEDLLVAAQHHKLLTQLRHRDRHRPVLSAQGRARLDTVLRVQSVVTRSAARELAEVLGALTRAGVEVVVLKGAVLAEHLPHHQPRVSSDHDLLVRPHQLPQVAAVLGGLGYEQQATTFLSVEGYRTEHHHDAPWMRPGATLIEVHRHPYASPLTQHVDVAAMFDRAVPDAVAGVTVLRLDDVDQAQHLAVHAVDDGPPRVMRGLWELAAWAQRLDAAGWDALEARSSHPIVARRVWAGLSAAEVMFPGTIPADVVSAMAEAGGVAVRVQRRWLAAVERFALDPRAAEPAHFAARALVDAPTARAARAVARRDVLADLQRSAHRLHPGQGPRAWVSRWVRFAGWKVRRAVGRRSSIAAPAPVTAVRTRPTGTDGLLRVVDVAGAIVLGVIALPVLAVLTAWLLLRSPGRPVYRQERVGAGGRRFEILKLRTMGTDAEDHSGPVLAAHRDPRVITGFATVRRLHLDELPQLWNVLRGDMSLVGPRPERPEFTATLEREVAGYAERHGVRPGLTGLAQIKVGYHATPIEKLHYDLRWVRQPSLGRYLRILLATPWSIALGPLARDTDPDFAPLPSPELVIDLRTSVSETPVPVDAASSVA